MAIRKDIGIIPGNGFNERIRVERAKAAGIREFVKKPCALNDPARTVRKVLMQQSAGWPLTRSQSLWNASTPPSPAVRPGSGE